MKTKIELKKLSEAFKKDSCYWGERSEWLLAYATNRDADTLARSNWRSFLRLLGGNGTEGAKGSCAVAPGVEIEEANHWACGWVQYLIIDPANAELATKVTEALEGLEDYPVLDEDDFSALEDEERQKCWADFARQEWFKWFAQQCETEADAEWFNSEHGEALETFLCRAYESTCMGHGEAGCSPCKDETLETAWCASECGYCKHDEKMKALAKALDLPVK